MTNAIHIRGPPMRNCGVGLRDRPRPFSTGFEVGYGVGATLPPRRLIRTTSVV